MDMKPTERPWSHRVTDAALFEEEQRRLGAIWTLLTLTTDVPHDGDWVRARLGGRSVFVQRFGEELRAYENVCAHRFYPLRTEDRGNGPVRCGFHHWQYDAEGAAVGIPKCMDQFGCRPKELGIRLKPVELAVCGTLIFGRFGDGRGPSLEEYLGPGFPIMEAMTRATRKPSYEAMPLAANWKLGFHVSMDDYHVVAVHPDTFGKAGYLPADATSYYRFGDHSAFFYAGAEDALEKMVAACRDGSYRATDYRIFQFFPNLLINHVDAAGTYVVVVQQYAPVSVDRTVLRSWAFPAPFPPGPQGGLASLKRRLAAPFVPYVLPFYVRKIGGEDIRACEGVQTVVAQAPTAPVVARHEERIGWFEETWAARMSDGVSGQPGQD